jgi:DNA-binding beta-propeller fold protein YncE
MKSFLSLLLAFQTAGPQPDGTVVLNTGWKVKPAGVSVPIGTLPMSRVVTRDGGTVFVLNGGFNPPSVSVLDAAGKRERQRLPMPHAWRGLALSADEQTLYAGQGSQPKISRFRLQQGQWQADGHIELGGQEGDAHLIGDLLLTPDGQHLLATDLPQNEIIAIRLKDQAVQRRIATQSGPYALTLDSTDPGVVWSSHWTNASIGAYRIATGETVRTLATGPHPNELLWAGKRLIVATANTNHIEIYSQSKGTWRQTEVVSLALFPKQPPGMTPSSLSLSPDGKTLLVACADANTVAVVDVSGPRAKVAGFVPAGWYPTGASWLAGGKAVIFNGRGTRSYPNPKGLTPLKWPNIDPKTAGDIEYVLRIQHGSAQFLDAWDAVTLGKYTATVRSLTPWRDAMATRVQVPAGNPIPSKPGGPTPFQHVILLMKENRTYDQVLGDMERGNNDKSLVLFGEAVTPNHHKLAREFTQLDNFYVNADVSADGYYWTTSAIAPDTTQRTMPISYARRGPRGKTKPTPEGLRTAPAGHIWDAALRAGKTIRNYGFTAVNLPKPPETGVQIAEVRDPVLKPHTSLTFRQHDRDFSDSKRMQVVIDDIRKWEKEGGMPNLLLITIGNDHTEGTTPGICTPQSCVADNDQALGLLVDALSHSKFWKDTALFVLEDDAQDGPDHVDSHRSPAYVISAYTRRGALDSTHYSTVSMLRTIELILGLPPMTHFDGAAQPMYTVFQNQPDLRPYTKEPPRVSLTDRNPPYSPTAARSRALDFSESDRIDDAELNDILYQAIQGRPAPAPRRSHFGERP